MKLDRAALPYTVRVLCSGASVGIKVYSPHLRSTWYEAIEELSSLRQRDEVLS